MTPLEDPETTGDDAPTEVDEQLQKYFAELPQANKDLLLEIFGGERTTPLTVEEVAERLGTKMCDADLTRFAGKDTGTIYGFQVQGLVPGQRIVVTDNGGESGTVQAKVLSIKGESAEIRIYWDLGVSKA
jgi:hypothetical protein